MIHKATTVAGVILAGGKSSRMNYTDKPLIKVGGKLIIEHILRVARTQVDPLIINTNRNIDHYTCFNLPILKDCKGEFAGPMAGILTAINWVKVHHPDAQAVACFPGDVPWFPDDIVERMSLAMHNQDVEVVWLRTNGQVQPLFSLWSVGLAGALDDALNRGMYSPLQFILSRKNTVVEYINEWPGAFMNINTPEDLAQAEDLSVQLAAFSGARLTH
ncbi:MAG: molybdenum cofactor guanylyltransferase MobA [Pseudomonadota bacterium]